MKTLDQKPLAAITQRLVTEFQPGQVWLFGSRAWDKPHEDSGVDLLVVVPHSDATPMRRSRRAQRCLRGLRMFKDVLVEMRRPDHCRHFRNLLGNRAASS